MDPLGCVRAVPGAQPEAAGLQDQGHPPATFVLAVSPLDLPPTVWANLKLLRSKWVILYADRR